MDGKIFGIPLILILLVVAISLSITVPMVALHSATQDRLEQVQDTQLNEYMQLQKIEKILTAPTATPEAKVVTPTPTRRVVKVTPTPTAQPTP